MSLASMASPWTTEETTPKKRQSTMRKTSKIRPNISNDNQFSDFSSSMPSYDVPSIDDVQQESDTRNQRVNDLINQMSTINADNDGAKLGNFMPPANPQINIKKDLQIFSNSNLAEQPIPLPENPLQIQPQNIKGAPGAMYSSVNNDNYSSYNNSYSGKMSDIVKPYYAEKMGLGAGDNKIMEKINYMIHMMENLEGEKTANITEEFILYTFLGVFVIFVVDSFSRTSIRYIR